MLRSPTTKRTFDSLQTHTLTLAKKFIFHINGSIKIECLIDLCSETVGYLSHFGIVNTFVRSKLCLVSLLYVAHN